VKGLVVLSFLSACTAFTRTAPAPLPRTTHLGLELQRLEVGNGLRVVIVRDPTASEVQVTMRYAVGSVDDPAGQEGIAHLVEHLMYQQVLGAQSLFAHLEGVATFFNGETTFDATTYVERANRDHLDELLSIEAVRAGLRCTSITDSGFERERAVVTNELRQRDAATQLYDALQDAAYPEGHPYRRPVGGSIDSVSAITRAQACAFADAHYAPNNAVLVVSGNISAAEVEASLKKFIAKLGKRAVTAQVALPDVVEPTSAEKLAVAAAVDVPAVVVAWRLPRDPRTQIRVRALANAVQTIVDAKIRGSINLVELGDVRAPTLALIAVPAEGEAIEQVTAAIDRTAHGLGEVFDATNAISIGELEFDRVQQSAIYRLFSSLEDGPTGARDVAFAADVLAGADPLETLAAELTGLRQLGRAEAGEVAAKYLGLAHARVVVLRPSGLHTGHEVTLAAAVHDLGQRRDPPDLSLAQAPLASAAAAPHVEAMRTRVLPNGMHVVLLPLASVPSVDLRLVFATGTGDEPATQRGAAMLSAYSLTWDYRYLNDLLLFAAAGGGIHADVDFDSTSFDARGVDMHLDLLLAGLRRLVRDGLYEPGAAHAANVIHRESKRDDDEGALTDAWRTALYGADHPYFGAGMIRHLNHTLTVAQLRAFRAAHYTPANATLVIAGEFDARAADRWIDYLFGDWSGAAPAPRAMTAAAPKPIALATYTDTSQIHVAIDLPALAGTPATRLVAAEMLAELAASARQELGASYDLAAALVSSRLASDYTIAGWIEAPRAAEALKLLAERIAALRVDSPLGHELAARTFVTARAKVVTHLRSLAGGAASLANRVEADVALGRPPLDDLETAHAVAALTIDGMTATLAELDLAHAIVALRGPKPETDVALAALGRTPTVLPPRPPPADVDEPDPTTATSQHLTDADLEPAITDAPPANRLTYNVTAGYTAATILELDVSGLQLSGELGYRFDEISTIGLHVGLGRISGDYVMGFTTPTPHTLVAYPIELAAYAQGTAYDRFFGTIFMGLHLTEISDVTTEWQQSLGAGLMAGVDIFKFPTYRVGVFAGLQGELLANEGYAAFTFGLVMRH
jgi:zinc protease